MVARAKAVARASAITHTASTVRWARTERTVVQVAEAMWNDGCCRRVVRGGWYREGGRRVPIVPKIERYFGNGRCELGNLRRERQKSQTCIVSSKSWSLHDLNFRAGKRRSSANGPSSDDDDDDETGGPRGSHGDDQGSTDGTTSGSSAAAVDRNGNTTGRYSAYGTAISAGWITSSTASTSAGVGTSISTSTSGSTRRIDGN
ncbi:hypothetical protein PC110_g2498 [Phytophthora cactorum]|uniref:Uncharacterized protein n=1 Tax=Phytophthora cactorum TaxID=29920 RepID=A0A329SZA6_9STRA|nr:hypothetical protein PC110_g2498 [Phytophthora cactorum]